MEKENNRTSRLNDSELMALINPQGTILANLDAIKSKGFKISKDRLSKFLKETRKNDNIRKNNNTRKNDDTIENKEMEKQGNGKQGNGEQGNGERFRSIEE